MVGLPGLSGGSLGSLIVRIDADNRRLKTGLRDSERLIDQSGKRISRFSQNIDATIRTINLLGTAFVIVGGLLVKSASDFETAFAGVRKTVDATEDEFFQLSEGIINMSKRIPVATKELARIQELAGQLGVRGVDNLTKFTEVIADIAVTTNLTSESAATDFARIANIMQLPLDQVDRMGASVVDLGNNFATTEAEIVSFATRIAGAGNVIGLTTADIFGIGTAFSSVGVRAERGGTAVNKALIKIAAAVQQGGEDLEKFSRISGQTQEQFVKGFEEDAAQAFAVFIEGLGRAGLEGVEILESLELGDQRLIQAFLSVGGASGILTEAVSASNLAFQENNALVEEANKRFGTTGSRTLILKNRVTALSISLGEKLLPAFQNILVSANAVVGVFDQLFGARQAPDSLENDLRTRIDLIDQEIEKRKELILTALGNAAARERAAQGINVLMQERSRALLTLIDIEQQKAQANDEQSVTDAKRLQKDATTEIKTQLVKQKTLLKNFAEFKKKVKELDDIELKSKLDKAKLEEITAKNLEEKKTEVLEEETKKRKKIEEKQAEIQKELFEQVGDTFERILRKQAEESKIAAIILKIRAIARATINTAEGVTKALSTANIPLAIAIGALGGAEIATIAGVQFQEGTDRVPAGGGFTHPEEIVVPQTFSDAIRSGRLTLGGPGVTGGRGDTAIVNNFQFDNVQLGDDIELGDFTERLGEDVAVKTRSVS